MTFEVDEAGLTRRFFDMAAETHRRSWEIAATVITSGPDLHGVKLFDPMKAMSMMLGGSFFEGPGVETLVETPEETKPAAKPVAAKKPATAKKPAAKKAPAKAPLKAVAKKEPVAVVVETAPAAETADQSKPRFLSEPMGAADDLTKIKGIGEKLNEVLHKLGIYHYWQIAGWSEDNADWVNEHLQFKGRIEREKWIEQAKALSTAGAAE